MHFIILLNYSTWGNMHLGFCYVYRHVTGMLGTRVTEPVSLRCRQKPQVHLRVILIIFYGERYVCFYIIHHANPFGKLVRSI